MAEKRARIRLKDIVLELDEGVYKPAEDSLLLLDSIESLGSLRRLKCLDVGTGTGIAAIYMARRGCETFATDITEESVELAYRNARINGVTLHVTQGDLMEHFRDSSFDIVTFNPPYLPESPSDFGLSLSWAGGLRGREVIDCFLSDLTRVLRKGGEALILHADYNEPHRTLKWGRERGFDVHIVGRRKLAFHELVVLELLRNVRAEHL